MIFLLDVNLLIALCDPYHIHHESAHLWFGATKIPLWATCPLTENAFIRITGKPSYPHGQGSAAHQWGLLREFCTLPGHSFWADGISLLQPEVGLKAKFIRSSQLTDVYLLALAVKNGGKLASFDRNLPAHAVHGGKETLVILPT